MKTKKRFLGLLLSLALVLGLLPGMTMTALAAGNVSTYTLQIPSTLTVSAAGWNATSGLTAAVSSGDTFDSGKKLSVTAASTNSWSLKSGDNTVSYNLATATGTYSSTAEPASWEFSADELNTSGGTTKTMGIIVEDYSEKPAGTYQDTVTFTASVEDAAYTATLTLGNINKIDEDGIMVDPINNTFSVGQQVAVFYTNTNGETEKLVTDALNADDISNEGKSANINVTIDDADKTEPVTYVYPASMVKDDGSINYDALSTQDGTLTSLVSDLDLATYTGVWNGDELPAGTLTNQLAILAIAVKNSDGSADLTGSITGLTVSDGTNTYTVNRTAANGLIYVAIQPTSGADISITATDGTQSYDNYGTFLSNQTYEASNGYGFEFKMLPRVDLSAKSGSYNVTRNEILTGTPSGNLTITYSADNWEVTLDNVNPSGTKDVRIETNKNVKVKLKGTSRLTRILVNGSGKNLTIDKATADGTLILQMGDTNSPLDVFGTVYIKGGTVKARNTGIIYAVYSNLNITGGAVYLAGGGYQRAVQGSVTGTLYGWNGAWGNYSSQQYATTDNTSGNPSSWTW